MDDIDSNEDSLEDRLSFKITFTAWVALSVGIYVFGLLGPWRDEYMTWPILGLLLGPLYAISLLIPVVGAYHAIDELPFFILYSLLHVILYFYIAIEYEPLFKEALLQLWPIAVSFISPLVALVPFLPIYGVYRVWAR